MQIISKSLIKLEIMIYVINMEWIVVYKGHKHGVLHLALYLGFYENASLYS